MSNEHDPSTLPGVTRRQAVGVVGATGAALLLERVSGPGRLLETFGVSGDAQAATTACSLTPAKTEGPYFVDEKLNRSDIRTDPTDGTMQAGVPLVLTMVVVRSDGECAPVPGATVDLWHANAGGKYSDESANNTSGKKYLRGSQVTDDNGHVTFTTVYPGWYSGRTIHMHFKIRLFDGSAKTYEFTSQIFFDPSVTATVLKAGAYSARGTPDTTNANDNIYGSDGDKLLLNTSSDGNGGYTGTFVAGVSGLPSTTTTGTNKVDAALAGATWRRTSGGRRVLRLNVTAKETVALSARVTRGGTTLAHAAAAKLTSGTHKIDIGIPSGTARGSARLTLTLTDTAGKATTVHKVLTIPRRA